MKQNNFPKTIDNAIDALEQHKLDPKYYENLKKQREQSRARRKENEQQTQAVASFAQKELICYCCGTKGHICTDCKKKNKIPPHKWAMHKAIQHMQDGTDNDDASADEADDDDDGTDADDDQSVQSNRSISSSNRRSEKQGRGQSRSRGRTWYQAFQVVEPVEGPEFNGFQDENLMNQQRGIFSQRQKFSHLDNKILLDNGSTIAATFMNPNLLTNIRVSKQPIVMRTNAGAKKMNLEGDLDGFGPAIYDPNCIANILGHSGLIDRGYRIVYDSDIADIFEVYTPDRQRITKFERTPEGLYAYKPSQSFFDEMADEKSMDSSQNDDEGMSNLVSTVKENRMGYTQQQYDRAVRARKFYHNVGCPTVANLKSLLRMNAVQNCPITTEDVDIAEKIFGPDVGTLKGKTTRKKSLAVRTDWVSIPPEIKELHRNLTLYLDILFVDKQPALTAIDSRIRYRSCYFTANQTARELFKGIDKIFRVYNKAGFHIEIIDCDRQFKALLDTVADELDLRCLLPGNGNYRLGQ